MILIRLCANDRCMRRDEVDFLGFASRRGKIYHVRCRYCGCEWQTKSEIEDDEPTILFRGKRVSKREGGAAIIIELTPDGKIGVRARGMPQPPKLPREVAEAIGAFLSRLLVVT